MTANEINALDLLATDPNLIAIFDDANSMPLIYIKPSGYLNSWSVIVNDGQAVADEIANQYGFTNQGQVSHVLRICSIADALGWQSRECVPLCAK